MLKYPMPIKTKLPLPPMDIRHDLLWTRRKIDIGCTLVWRGCGDGDEDLEGFFLAGEKFGVPFHIVEGREPVLAADGRGVRVVGGGHRVDGVAEAGRWGSDGS